MKDKKSKTARISVCMMVKNEEEMLPDALESVKDIADEIIVVDTGSTDRTMEIARSYGAKIYEHPWENDFSKHRNQSISYATGDWFLILDADERIDTQNVDLKKLKQKLAELSGDVNCVFAIVQDYKRSGDMNVTFLSPRIFRNGVGAHYEGIVHNRPVVEGKSIPSDLIVKHYGYDLTPEKMEAKHRRTLSLLKERINRNPKDFDAYYYLANLYGASNNHRDAINAGELCINCLPVDIPGKEFYYGVYYAVGFAHFKLGEYEKAVAVFKEGLKYLKKDVDLYFMLTACAVKLNDWEMLLEYSDKYLEFIDTFREKERFKSFRFIYYIDSNHEQIVRFRYLLALIYNRKRVEYLSELKNLNSMVLNSGQKQLALVDALLKNGFFDDCAELIINFHRNATEKEDYINQIFVSSESVGIAREVIEKVRERLSSSPDDLYLFAKTVGDAFLERKIYNSAVEHYQVAYSIYNESEALLSNYALAMERSGNIEKALELFDEGLRRNIRNVNFLMNAVNFFYFYHSASVESPLSALLEQIDSYAQLPDDLLLILADFLLEKKQIETLLQITDMLLSRNSINMDGMIGSIEQFSDIYQLLGQHYLGLGQFKHGTLALNISINIDERKERMQRVAEFFVKYGLYNDAAKMYSRLIEKEGPNAELVKKLKTVFEKSGNEKGIQECEHLLDQL